MNFTIAVVMARGQKLYWKEDLGRKSYESVQVLKGDLRL